MGHNFKELKLWKDSMAFAKEIFTVTQSFPSEEKFGMISQMRRCAVSIPSNIAEGSGRTSNREFSRFLDISLGSAYEIETQFYYLWTLFMSRRIIRKCCLNSLILYNEC